jgi:signal peptidase I
MRQLFRLRLKTTPRLSCLLLATVSDLIVTSLQERFNSMLTPSFGRRLAYVASGAVLFLAASTTILRAYVIPTPSMEPSLRPGDHVIVNKLAHAPQRDELVVFHYPLDKSQTYIKRVIGIPGDHIRLANKHVMRNGQPLTEAYTELIAGNTNSYRDNFPATPEAGVSPEGEQMLAHNVTGGEVVVPAGELFVLGDNRDISWDSRYFGFVPLSNVIGRPWFVYWSYDKSTRHTRWDRTLLTTR